MSDSNSNSSGDNDIGLTDLVPSPGTVVKIVKPGIGWLWNWINGYKMVLLGPQLAGKTRFFKYLCTRQVFEDELTDLARAKNRTIEPDKSNLLVLKVGAPGVLFRLRIVIDSPGLEGKDHAKNLIDTSMPINGAHVVVVVLDGSNRNASIKWIQDFTTHLAPVINKAHKLCKIFVLLNKYDIAKSYYEELESDVNKKLSAYLKPIIGARANRIKIYPTILIEHTDAYKLLDQVVSDMAFSLQKRPKKLSRPSEKSTNKTLENVNG